MNLTPGQTTAALFVLVLTCIGAFATWMVSLPLKVVHLWAISATIILLGFVVAWMLIRRQR